MLATNKPFFVADPLEFCHLATYMAVFVAGSCQLTDKLPVREVFRACCYCRSVMLDGMSFSNCRLTG